MARAIVPSTPSMTSATPSQANISAQSCATAAISASSPSAAPVAVNTWTANAACHANAGTLASSRALPSSAIALPFVAPLHPAHLGRAAGEVPVAAECAHARGLGARDRDLGRYPVLAVADRDVLARTLAAHRADAAVDDLRDPEDARLAVAFEDDLLLAHAEEAAHQDLEERGRPAGAAGEDAG